MKKTTCELCGKKAKMVEQFFQGYMEDDFFEIFFCKKCYTSFTVNNNGGLNRIYDLIYQYAEKVPGYDRYYRYYDTIKNEEDPMNFLASAEESYWVVKDALAKIRNTKNEISIIEVGSGLGYLTYALNIEGYNALGVDISQEAVEKAIKKFGSNYECANVLEYAKEHIEQYDVVVLSEVIEHIEKPVEFLKLLCLMLKRGGCVILATPNRTIYSRKVAWASDLPPVHLWWFSEMSMQYIGNMLGVNTVFTDFFDYYKNRGKKYFLFYWDKKNIRPVFNSNGELIVQSNDDETQIKRHTNMIKEILKKIPFFTYVVRKIKYSKKYYMCGKSGPILGVIFEKR
jgi:SAM-dependent methyltransferase